MTSQTPSSPPEDRRQAVGFVIKGALVLSLIAMVVGAVRLIGTTAKAPEETAPTPAEPDVTQAPETSDPAKNLGRLLLQPHRRQFQPSAPEPMVGPRRSAEAGASNLWASLGSAPQPGFLMAARLPELLTGIDGVIARLEQQVWYKLPAGYGATLSNRLAEIRTATNALQQFDFEFQTLIASADRDHKEYVQQAKLANAQRRAEGTAALKRLTDLQALYLDRKREFQQESARIKPQLQDSPAQFEAKLALYRKASAEYQNDIDQLEAGIHTLQKELQTTSETLNAQDQNIERAYELSAQDVLGQLNVLSNRVHNKLGEVNTAIRDYNAKLIQYGTPNL